MLRPAGAQESLTLLVHLPELPIEAGNRAAEAVNALGSVLDTTLPGTTVEVQLFRRLEDARALLAQQPRSVAFILAEPAFLLNLSDPDRFQPRYRFVRDGQETFRRLLVVRGDRAEEARWDDVDALRGASLSFVEITGGSPREQAEHLGRTELPRNSTAAADPAGFFRLTPVQDEFSAAANVIFRQSDAALVAEHNPLLQEHRDELKVLYRSPPLSLPVLAVARETLTEEQLQMLDASIPRLRPGAGDIGREALAQLQLERLAVVPSAERSALLHGRKPTVREPEIALPPADGAPVPALPAVEAAGLSFALTVDLPEVPILQDDSAELP
jgi:hypothetical protein